MPNQSVLPPLKPLHPETSLSPAKLAMFDKLPSEALKQSLVPGQTHGLKTRPDGTILDGHHRIHILRGRNEDVDVLPREILDLTRERQQEDLQEQIAREKARYEAQERERGQEHEQEY